MTAISVGSPGDLLVTLPYQLGYHPHCSMVVVAMAGRSIVCVARMPLDDDLPDQGALRGAAQAVLDRLSDAGPDAVMLVGYESRRSESGRLMRAFRGAARRQGLTVTAEMLVRGDRYWVRREARQRWAGPGAPLPEPSRVPAVADFVGLGASPVSTRASLALLVACDGSDLGAYVTRLVEKLLTGEDRARASTGSVRSVPPGRSAPPGRWAGPEPANRSYRADRTTAGATWRTLLSTEPAATGALADATTVAGAVAALVDRSWRDALLAWICPGSLPLTSVPADLRMALRGVPQLAESRVRPADRSLAVRVADAASAEDRQRDAQGRRVAAVLHRMAQLLPDRAGTAAAAVLTVDAHVCWWQGDGAMAAVALDRALSIDPEYTLARLLDRLVTNGIRPGGAA